MDDNTALLAALKGQPQSDQQPTADQLAEHAHQLMMTQALRDPATFDPKTYAPTDPWKEYSPRNKGPAHGLYDMAHMATNTVRNAVDAAKVDAYHDFGPGPSQVSDSDPPYQSLAAPASAEAAMNLAGIGAPGAEAGAAGIFGGKLANGADLAALERAKSMRSSSLADHYRQGTGWFKGADGQWRFEIPDQNSKLYNFGQSGSDRVTARDAPLSSILNHPEAYKAYPGLKDFKVDLEMDPSFKYNSGGYGADKPKINVAAPNSDEARSVLLHEMQHIIQHLEGFSTGSTIENMKEMLKEYPDYFKSVDPYMTPFQAYQRTVGETESRNVEKRRDMTNTERYEIAPWFTQDYPGDKQMALKPIDPRNWPVLGKLLSHQRNYENLK